MNKPLRPLWPGPQIEVQAIFGGGFYSTPNHDRDSEYGKKLEELLNSGKTRKLIRFLKNGDNGLNVRRKGG